ncbi:MAG: UDP-2,3-diacylglucosamine diphosphatase LpxI [Planctomycetaceae bacterium]
MNSQTDSQIGIFGERKKIGLLAGAGQFPIDFARAARRQGHYVVGLGVKEMASEELRSICHSYSTVPLTKIGRAIRCFRRAGVTRAVMAGKIHKVVLFRKFRWLRNLPDWRAVHMWLSYAAHNKKDDTLLLAVIREFERDQILFESALDYCPELLVPHGFLTKRKPSSAQWRDIRFGWDLAKEMGRLDVGQTVCVNDTAVIAVEAIEGTDEAIKRAGTLCKRGGFTVVKVAKPQQDRRFDVPTVGLETIQNMYESGGRVLAIESGETIMIGQDEVIELANRLGITIVSLHAEELSLSEAS